MKSVAIATFIFWAQILAAQGIQIDSGYAAGSYTAPNGTLWQTDQYSTGGDGLYTSNAIQNTTDPALYRTARYGLYSNFGYQIPTANGIYNVTLKFAEIRYSAAGERVFNITINGTEVLTNFDILSHTSLNTALDETFPVSVANGLIDIEFIGVVNGGIVNAIQIQPSSAQTLSLSAPASTVVSGQSLQFAANLTGGSGGTQPAIVVWSATGGTISNTGLFTAPAVAANTQLEISAQTVGAPVLQSQMQVTVLPPATPTLSVAPQNLSFAGTVGSVIPGQTLNIASTGGALTWTVSGVPAWLTLTIPTQSTPSTVTVTPNPAALATGTYNATILITAAGATGSPSAVPVTLTLASPVSSGTTPTIQLNAGFRTTPYTGADGTVWPTDAYFNGGDGIYTGSPISGSSEPILYQTARYGLYSDFSYQIPVMNGTYSVTLKFAEIKYSAQGQRVFNVAINGISVLKNFDILAQTSPFTALDKTFPVTVSNNAVNIAVTGVVNGGIVNAIQVSPTGSGPQPGTLSISAPSSTVTSGQTLQFTAVQTGAGGTPTVTWAATQGMIGSPGLYTAPAVAANTSVTISAQTTSTPTLSAQTTITVSPVPAVPTLAVSPTSLSFTGAVGGTLAPQLLTIQNTSGGALSWTAAANPSWLGISASSGATPGTVTVTANSPGLSAGIVNGSITFSAPGAAGSPFTVPVTLTLSAGGGSQFYVAPTGSSSGNGSIGNPWDLQTALSQPASVAPGSTIWLRGGTYGNGTTEFTSILAGTLAAPILVKQYPSERATVNGGISVNGPYTWYWGFEIMSSNPDRSQGAVRQECMDTYPGSTGVKVINMVLHDCLQGIGFWVGATDAEMNGNLLYFNGETGTTRGIGHSIYTQNQTGTKTINDNIFFDTFDIGFQGYGSGAAFVQNYSLDGNVSFNNGSPVGAHVDNILFAVGSGLDNISVSNSYTYHTPVDNSGYSRLGWQFGANNNGTLTATGNYWIGGGGGEASIEMWGWNNINYMNNVSYSTGGMMLMLHPGAKGTANYSFDHNQYYGSGLISLSGNLGGLGQMQGIGLDAHSTFSSGRPVGTWSFVRPNKYEAGRANIVLYNWGLLPSVSVDLSSVLKAGDPYVIRDSENYYGSPVSSGTYSGAPVAIPMIGLTKAVPVGYRAIAHTAPEFGVFIVSHQ